MCATPGHVCSTADYGTWTCLFYSRLYCPWTCLLESTCCDVPGFGVSVHTFAVRWGVWLQQLELHPTVDVSVHKSLCCTCKCLYTWVLSVCKILVVHLLTCFCAALRLVCLQELLCCSWTCLCKIAFVLLLDMSVYNSSCCFFYSC